MIELSESDNIDDACLYAEENGYYFDSYTMCFIDLIDIEDL